MAGRFHFRKHRCGARGKRSCKGLRRRRQRRRRTRKESVPDLGSLSRRGGVVIRERYSRGVCLSENSADLVGIEEWGSCQKL